MVTDGPADSAEEACVSWVTSWRELRRGELLPSLTFAAHVGREAVEMMRSGVGRVDLLRIFSSAGFEGVCPCGMRPGDAPRLGGKSG